MTAAAATATIAAAATAAAAADDGGGGGGGGGVGGEGGDAEGDPLAAQMRDTVVARLRSDAIVCVVIAVLVFAVHCSTVFQVRHGLRVPFFFFFEFDIRPTLISFHR